MAEFAIEVENLCKSFGAVVAVDDVNFSIKPGELVGFLGPNGAGKSTTMRILTTWLPASSGVARVGGFDTMSQSMDVRRQIGYLPESVPLYPEMRVEEYLIYRAKLRGIERSGRTQRLEDCLEKCRIREVRRRLLGTLSKGYRQRVGLADAMIHNPPILILDEPTSGLDPVQIRETLSTIKALGGSHTILLSTHILSEVEAICERILIINKGTLKSDVKLSTLAEQTPTLVVEVRGPISEVTKFLEKEDGVVSVKANPISDNVTTYELQTTAKHSDMRETVASGLVKQGWGVRRLDLRRRTLEDLFMDVVIRDRGLTR